MSPSQSIKRTRISLASGAGRQGSAVGLVGAIVLHLAVVGATLFTWEHRLDIVEESPPVVPVDLVTLAQKTNIAPRALPAPKIAPVPLPQAAPQNVTMPAPTVAQDAEPAPQPVVKPPPPKEKPVPPKKSAADKLAAILNQWTTPQAQTTSKAKPAEQAHKGFGQQNAMTMDLRDSLKNQIEQCWNPPAGAPNPEQLIVSLDLSLNPDGSVARPPQLAAESANAASGNPFLRAAADAAKRAIYVCAPYKLPADRYADWRDSTVRFDPRDLAGQ